MAFFKYVVKNEHGDKVKGRVEARNETQAAATLRERGLLVIDLIPFEDESFSELKQAFSGVKHGDIVNFTRQLATMITAGLPLVEALSILEQQSEKASLTKMIAEILRDIEGGGTFSKAIEKQSVFSRVYVHLVRAGEAGGVMDEILQRLADTMEKSKEFRSRVRGALIYPMIVVIAMLVVGAIMMIFVIPKLTEMYADFGAELPLPTKILIGMSNIMVNFWWLIAILVGVGIFAIRSWNKTSKGMHTIDNILFRIPVFGTLRQKVLLTEFARTLSLMMSAGISLLQALEIVGSAMSSIGYREAIQEASKRVEKGMQLSQAMQGTGIFPPILFQMIAVGEETGKLDEVLLKLSEYFESESDHAVKNLTTALEPLIMIVLGVGVGAMVIAIIMPIYNLTSQF